MFLQVIVGQVIPFGYVVGKYLYFNKNHHQGPDKL